MLPPFLQNLLELLDLEGSGEKVVWPPGFTALCARDAIDSYFLADPSAGGSQAPEDSPVECPVVHSGDPTLPRVHQKEATYKAAMPMQLLPHSKRRLVTGSHYDNFNASKVGNECGSNSSAAASFVHPNSSSSGLEVAGVEPGLGLPHATSLDDPDHALSEDGSYL